ncbi:MAG: PKD domain-containing protein, partial [Planctomycetia bacterium]
DVVISIDSITYDPITFEAVITIDLGSTPLLDGLYQFTIQGDDPALAIHDLAGNPLGNGADAILTFTVNTPPVLDPVSNLTGNEGQEVTLSATYSDPGYLDSYTAMVDWGDGSVTPAVVTPGTGGGTIEATHTYADNGVYAIQVTLLDAAGGSVSGQAQAAIGNIAPSVTPVPDQQVAFGTLFDLNVATFTDPGFTSATAGTSETFTATINWGDGSPTEPATVNVTQGGVGILTTGTVHGQHVFNLVGDYVVTITVSDDDGGTTTANFTVHAVNSAPVITGIDVSAGDENENVDLLATFTDPDDPGLHTAVIDWGDGSTSSGVVTFESGAGTIAASHVYADNGTYLVQVTLVDTAGDSVTGQTNAVISNVAPTVVAAVDQTINEGDTLTLDVATFTDPGFTSATAGTEETFTATIDWGDGAGAEPGTVTVTQGSVGVATSGVVAGAHVYLDEGTYTVTVVVTDDDGGTHSDTFTVSVANVAPVITGVNSLASLEGSTLQLTGTFTDAGESDTHTATIYWGDGTSSAAQVTTNAGQGTIAAEHVYADNGTYAVQIELSDNSGATTTWNGSAVIDNVTPTVVAAADQTIEEGDTLALDAATFTDPGFTFTTAGTEETFTATIDWGDGAGPQPATVTVSQGSAGVATGGIVAGEHLYLGRGDYTVTVVVTDDDGGTHSDTFTVSVQNVAPVITGVNNLSSLEGNTLQLAGTFTDTGLADTHTATIDWGDGTSSVAQVTTNAGQGMIAAEHIYADNGTYAVQIVLSDDSGATTMWNGSAVIDNVAPTVVAAADQTIEEGDTLTLDAATFTDPGFTFTTAGTEETFTATIDWGDGAGPQPATVTVTQGSAGVATGGIVAGEHLYLGRGDYTVTVFVTDDDGGTHSDTFTVSVQNAAPVITGMSSLPSLEGGTFQIAGTFTDTGLADTHTATIYWGDGTSSAAQVTTNDGQGTIEAEHVYADNGTYAVQIVLSDNSGATTTWNGSAQIGNVAPTVVAAADQQVGVDVLLDLNVATFTDPGFTFPTAGTEETFTATIDWGDSSTPEPGTIIVVQGGVGVLTTGTVHGQHIYGQGGVYTVTVTVEDDDSGIGTASFMVTVAANVAPVITDVTELSGNEGDSLGLVATFTDASDPGPHTATIDWGDGSTTSGVVMFENGAGTITGDHVYADNGTYAISVEITDAESLSDTGSSTAVVANVVPTLTTLSGQSVSVGEVFTLPVGTFTDPGFTNVAAGTEETFTATVNWGDGSPTETVTVTVTQGSAGVLTTGTIVASHMYSVADTYTVTVTLTDDDGGSDSGSFTLSMGPKFLVVDQCAQSVFSYDENVNLLDQDPLLCGLPRGIASSPTGDRAWVVDLTGRVDVYDSDGNLEGTWWAPCSLLADGIATDGNDIWIVSGLLNRVYHYEDGANFLNGLHCADSSFSLVCCNMNPTGMTTDGETIWVTNNNWWNASVYVYSMSGSYLGSWRLGCANSSPTGIAIDTSTGDLWVVDSCDDAVYCYADAADWRCGCRVATDCFDLAPGNFNPQGIADPTTTINIGDVIGGAIDVGGEIEEYLFDAVAGQELYFDWQVGSSSNFWWTLESPTGTSIFNVSARDRGPAVLTETGTYTLTVRGYYPDDTGTFGFQINDITPAPAVGINVGTAVSGTISTAGEYNTYTFDSTMGEVLFFDPLSGSSSYLDWTLIAPSGTPVFDGVNYDERGPIEMTETGQYTLIVDGYNDY